MSEITKAEWLRRASQHYVDRAQVQTKDADEFAKTLYEDFSDESPEDAVDEDLSHWGD